MEENSVDNNILNVYNGGQVIVANDHAMVYAVQNNVNGDNIHQAVKSRTQEYAKKWDSNMFLNDFSEWDEKAGTNVKLKDVYIDEHLPHFIWRNNEKKSDNLDVLLLKYISKKIENKMLLILGQPGIGKSTLITWIISHFIDRIDDILVYKFASDVYDIDWRSGRISNEIFEKLELTYNGLNGKILILDGFDEINVDNDRKDILDCLYWDLIHSTYIEDFTLIITCRENYINGFESVQCDFITLLPWDDKQIQSFCRLYAEIIKDSVSGYMIKNILENKEILGIPLILYMTVALDIRINEESSIVDIYDKIFSLEGGIYDRCIANKNFAERHRIGAVKKQIHQISREIAIWIFENKSVEAFIPQEQYLQICESVMMMHAYDKEEIKQDFLIGNFFKIKHCAGMEAKHLYFVHRSIYEYFIAETIYNSIENAMIYLTCESQEDLARNIAEYLKQGKITYTVGIYLKNKILKLYNKLDSAKKEKFYSWWENAVSKMIESGMFFYTKRNIQNYGNIISKECQCFVNLMRILRLLFDTGKMKYIMGNVNNKKLEKYVRLYIIETEWIRKNIPLITADIEEQVMQDTDLQGLNLAEMDLQGVTLVRVNLEKTNLEKANLERANLERANLHSSYLVDVNLRKANLKKANLEDANLEKANLKEANLFDANLTRANLYGANLYGATLTGVNLTEVNLKEMDLIGANLYGAILIRTVLIKTELRKTDLREASLVEAILSGADLRKGDLRKADLRDADLSGADLKDADLRDADLRESNLEGADMRGAIFDEYSVFDDKVTLRDTIIDESHVNYLKRKCNLHDVKVYLRRNKEIVNYKDYCRSK